MQLQSHILVSSLLSLYYILAWEQSDLHDYTSFLFSSTPQFHPNYSLKYFREQRQDIFTILCFIYSADTKGHRARLVHDWGNTLFTSDVFRLGRLDLEKQLNHNVLSENSSVAWVQKTLSHFQREAFIIDVSDAPQLRATTNKNATASHNKGTKPHQNVPISCFTMTKQDPPQTNSTTQISKPSLLPSIVYKITCCVIFSAEWQNCFYGHSPVNSFVVRWVRLEGTVKSLAANYQRKKCSTWP